MGIKVHPCLKVEMVEKIEMVEYFVTKVYLKNAEQETLLFLHHPEVLLKGY